MDARTNPPALLSWELITPENVASHLPAVGKALGLTPDSLQLLFSENHLAALSNDLEINADDINNMIFNSISETAESNHGDDALTVSFLQNRYANLVSQQNNIAEFLAGKNKQVIDDYREAQNFFMQQILSANICHLGNYAVKLDIFKRNIAISLQNAAYTLHQLWPDLRTQPDQFNAIFSGIAMIQANGNLLLEPTASDQFAALSIAELQTKISAIHHAAYAHTNPMVVRGVRANLENLNHHRETTLKQGDALLTLNNNDIVINRITFDIEKLAIDAAAFAAQGLSRLDKIEQAKRDELEHNSELLLLLYKIRNSMQKLPDDLTALRNIHSKIESTAKVISGDREDTTLALANAEHIVNAQPIDSREQSAHLLLEAGLKLPPAHQQQILNALQDLLTFTHQRFMQETKLDFLLTHGAGLLEQFKILHTELKMIGEAALKAESPITIPVEKFKAIEARRVALRQSLDNINATLDKINAERHLIYNTFETQRTEFIKLLAETLKNDWRPDLEQRLDATLLDIDDLIQKYSEHPAFPHTILDDALINLLSDYREQTLATQRSLAPELPPSQENRAEPSFLRRRPVLSYTLIGAGIGLAASLLAGFITVITGGLGLIPIALIVIGIFTLAGALSGGIVAKIYTHIPQHNSAEAASSTKPGKSSRSSSANIIDKTGGLRQSLSDTSAREFDDGDLDDSEDEIERVADYSKTGGLVADDSKEYVPAHLRRDETPRKTMG